jgi:cathepsin B
MFGLLGALVVYVIVMTFVSQAPPLHKVFVVDKDKIDSFNIDNLNWKQDANTFFEGASLAYAKKLFGSGFSSSNNLNRCFNDDTIIPPESFHVKDTFVQCTLPIEDTGKLCGSSYAFVLAQTLAERTCIANSSEKSINLSAQELLTCDSSNNGCKGGQLNTALEYITSKGLVEQECYKYKPQSDKCEGLCEIPNRSKADFICLLIGEDEIKRDIMKNGAVVSTLQIYIDILTYKSGVYTKGDDIARFSGQHAIKIFGW